MTTQMARRVFLEAVPMTTLQVQLSFKHPTREEVIKLPLCRLTFKRYSEVVKLKGEKGNMIDMRY